MLCFIIFKQLVITCGHSNNERKDYNQGIECEQNSEINVSERLRITIIAS